MHRRFEKREPLDYSANSVLTPLIGRSEKSSNDDTLTVRRVIELRAVRHGLWQSPLLDFALTCASCVCAKRPIVNCITVNLNRVTRREETEDVWRSWRFIEAAGSGLEKGTARI